MSVWFRFKKWFDQNILLWPDAPTHETAAGIFFCLMCAIIVFVVAYYIVLRATHLKEVSVAVAIVMTLALTYLYVRPTIKRR
jgi:membrane protein YdbS with pleckstrin-like domain